MAADVVVASRDALERELAALVTTLPLDLSVTSIVSTSPPGPALITEARRGCHDTIVVGVPAGLWHRLSGGSTAPERVPRGRTDASRKPAADAHAPAAGS